MWGKPNREEAIQLGLRNIPTRVGKTSPVQIHSVTQTEHPHACGENGPAAVHRALVLGTSPRVWGKRRLDVVEAVGVRNIPTRVGKTHGLREWTPRWSEHPHACGENLGCGLLRADALGTSPRVWGKPEDVHVQELVARNIPTRVGKTRPARWWESPRTEHPHACGENLRPCPPRLCGYGTSPRVWGKRNQRRGNTEEERNIPTRVGKTLTNAMRARCTPEHPHACGENLTCADKFYQEVGTSPRVWGKQCLATIRNV